MNCRLVYIRAKNQNSVLQFADYTTDQLINNHATLLVHSITDSVRLSTSKHVI